MVALVHAVVVFQHEWRGKEGSPYSLHRVLSVDTPWAVPSLLYRIPVLPVRIYLRVGDALLFRLWWWSRPIVYALVDGVQLDRVEREWQREGINARLARADDLGHAPDGGTFEP